MMEEAKGRMIEESKGETTNLRIEDLPLLRDQPWLLGGTNSAAQQAGLRELEKLVRQKDSQGFYDKYEREGYTLSFMDKVYFETTLLFDEAREQRLAEADAATVAHEEAQAFTEPVVDEPILPEIITPVATLPEF